MEVHNVEAYHYDGECLAKAAEFGKAGALTIRQLQARRGPGCAQRQADPA